MIKSGIISGGVRGAVLTAALLTAGCADAARGFSDREMDRFVTAMVAVGCTVNAENAEVVEEATGFTDEKLMLITDYLDEKKLVIKSDGPAGIILINEGCP